MTPIIEIIRFKTLDQLFPNKVKAIRFLLALVIG